MPGNFPIIIVGRWMPDLGKEKIDIYTELRETPMCQTLSEYRRSVASPDIRCPEENVVRRGFIDKSSEVWHRDCHGEARTCFIWSTVKTTEFRWKYGRKVWQPEPFDIVAWDNQCEDLVHRRPPGITIDDNRWSFILRTSIRFDECIRLFPESRKGGFV